MGKTAADKKYFTFVKGLNTEAGPLTYPPDTWADGDNVVPQLDGSLHKRLAMNYESGFAVSGTLDTPVNEFINAYTVHEWNTVGGDGTLNFLVVQRGNILYFYTNTGNAISPTEKSFTISLSTYIVPGGESVLVAPISCVSAMGNLVVVGNAINPIVLTYDPVTPTVTAQAITLNFRDFIGLDDGLAVDTRPGTLSTNHQYNLQNQGWTSAQWGPYFTADTVYPSNAQVWSAGKDGTGAFSAAQLDKMDFGTSPAPRGRYLLNLFNRDRATVSGVVGIAVEAEITRPTTCAFFAGRIWYAGMQSSAIGSWVLFSQVATTTNNYGKCYQDADPTSQFVSDLVDSDGGVIPIQDIGTIVKLVPAFNSLIIMADNGVWQISGTISSGFSASAYQVIKLTSVGCIGAQSVVEAEDSLFYWAADGIWSIQRTPTGSFSVQSITQLSIKTFYGNIPVIGRQYCRGCYYLEGKTIYWAYNSDISQDGINRRYKKNRLLCLDLRLGSWFTMTVSSTASGFPYMLDLVVTKNKTTFTPVNGRNTDVRFLTMTQVSVNTFSVTFSCFEDGLNIPAKFKDWFSSDSTGATYDAFILTGYDVGQGQGGDHIIQGLYITVFLKRTETGVDSSGNPITPSSCTLQTRWDWTDSAGAGKWSAGEQVYRHKRLFQPSVPSATYDDSYPVVVTKSKVRGRGRAVQFKFTADPEKDMQIVGWAVPFVGNANV